VKISTSAIILSIVAVGAIAAVYFATRPDPMAAPAGAAVGSGDNSVASLVTGIGSGLTTIAGSIAQAASASSTNMAAE
jgi:hypothetical protein